MDKKNLDNTPFIRLSGISKGFDYNDSPIEILKDASLTINQGESIAVEGESGIGKSTLLHILGTLDTPDSGHFFFKGKDVFAMDKTELATFRNTTIGFVFQFHYLLAEFTAMENVMIPGFIAGMGKKAISPQAEEILVRVGLKDRLFHRVNDLSGGEQQRVALARALVMKPRILLADEPTGNLDIKNSSQVHEFLMQLNQEMQMTMVVVTHNAKLAMCMQKRMTIHEGKLVER
jgi:lipoprotein-releasing system ATP-binding protein